MCYIQKKKAVNPERFDIKNNGTVQSINRTHMEIDDNFGILQKRRDGTAKTSHNSFRFIFTAKDSA